MKLPAFEIIGSREKAVAIVEIPEEMKDMEKEIAEEIMKRHKNVRSVLAKAGERKGELRLREYKLIAGEEDTEVIHKEYGYLLKLDPRKVYFSPREATERQRIASKVTPGESVLVMFSGVAPFAIAIAKKQPLVKEVICVEKNPVAHQYALENIRINKLSHKIRAFLGDVRDVCPNFFKRLDRVLMPLPKGAGSFLDLAVNCLKNSGIIHYYSWIEDEDFEKEEEKIRESFKNLHRNFIISEKIKVLPYAPRRWKIRLDIKVI